MLGFDESRALVEISGLELLVWIMHKMRILCELPEGIREDREGHRGRGPGTVGMRVRVCRLPRLACVSAGGQASRDREHSRIYLDHPFREGGGKKAPILDGLGSLAAVLSCRSLC